MEDYKIDFVVTWVDGNDPAWIAEKNKYRPQTGDNSGTSNRFRDWDLMRFWFRGVEKYAPWVNKIFFVTCGHYPQWLNLDHPKLRLVSHNEYIPAELLPTFNSNTIEMYLNRIKDLSEHFVLFNDDIFLISDTEPNDFFIDGKPYESAVLSVLSATQTDDIFPHILLNNIAVINKHFNKKQVIRENRRKYMTLKYGKELIGNLLLMPFRYFSYFKDAHLSSSHLKSIFDEVWETERDVLYKGSLSRFRSTSDVNHWLLKEWYLCKGFFEPRNIKWGKKFELGIEEGFAEYITGQKGKEICLNDSFEGIDYETLKKQAHDSFNVILHDKSSFEV